MNAVQITTGQIRQGFERYVILFDLIITFIELKITKKTYSSKVKMLIKL